MKIKIAPDVPQELLDVFNRLRWSLMPKPLKQKILFELKMWADQNMQFKTGNETLKSNAKKTISRDFDKILLEMLNNYDWSIVTNSEIVTITNYLNHKFDSEPLLKPFLKNK